jgi:excinuclease ABC subunit C
MPQSIDLSGIPKQCGVYLMKNGDGEIIYIGKAKDLKKRVSSYFQKNHAEPKTRVLVSRIEKIDFITTQSEAEAFLLEDSLIKKHLPRYNVLLKDNKSYPFVAIDRNEPFPRVYVTREQHRKGVKYYGPYPRSAAARYLVKIAVTYFHLRPCTCKIKPEGSDLSSVKPCLYYHIGKCPGYCLWNASHEDYMERLRQFTQFLSGRYSVLERDLKSRMEEYSKNLEFEKAAELRDLLTAVEDMKEKQQVYLKTDKDIDVFGFFEEEEKIFFTVLHFTEGRLINKRTFKLEYLTDKESLLSETMSRFYAETPVPDKIYIPFDLENRDELEEFFRKAGERKTEILFPQSGIGISLIKQATHNARYEFLAHEKMTNRELALKKLKEILNLPTEPRRIEGYDIANVGEKWAAGACVSFFNGKPDKQNYRHFSIKYVQGQNDYAMLQETLFRRLRLNNSVLPDLILIDGGKGQLNAALEVLVRMEVKVPIISLAKKEELIFQPHRPDPVRLDIHDPALRVLMEVRDEVHRFVNRLHNKLRMRSIKTSSLESVPGVGPKRRQQLLSVFGSLENLKRTSAEEIHRKGNVPLSLAETIKEALRSPEEND